MKTIKMKKLLEGFAWEREPGKPLPTLADVTRKHAMNEQDPAAMAQSLGMKSPSTVHKADFFMFLLNKFGADDDVKKKLKMKL